MWTDTKNFEVLTADPVRLAHSPARRFRHWSPEEKARIVAETLLPGANVSQIARSHDLDPSQVFAWRRKALSSGMIAPSTDEKEAPVKFTRFDAVNSTAVEIVVGDVVMRVGSNIEPRQLAGIIRAVRQA
ncbi:transposase [Brucella anthropi]|uniref:Transposase IS3/IS911 family protein n=1 Tax=Brucella anthropi (strain ATCC 49188 / DSM 6882 / CCUG 24695 / JCM 21032 / LMG 3331 / NBRC 15819 / NCTC 12168 / Alc 37) TaxID=439375 RepID=A6X2I1_BRUA4|nr:transposase [Brucella anthropi]ABS15435.1 transposase IS3/IS911 family protein [Brucella anthropi ATCC 49188]NKC48709.1 transposase [Brucella anthropi ATCC 49188]QQC24325.1 transposase [Brucella anthropi]